MLVEIIMGKETGDKALATALDYVRAIKKTPIVVNDSRGFFANRCVLAYILEGHLMLIEGVPPAMIEKAGKQAGMPVGPAVAQRRGRRRSRPQDPARPPRRNSARPPSCRSRKSCSRALVEKEGRLGRKNRKGFYDYPEGGPEAPLAGPEGPAGDSSSSPNSSTCRS